MKSIYTVLFLQCLVLLLSVRVNLASGDEDITAAKYLANERKDLPGKGIRECAEHEFYNSCSSECEVTCDDVNNDDYTKKRCTGKNDCVARCHCSKGYVRENVNGNCIRVQECPRVKH